jgi:signal transduction histidine kinase
MDAALAALLASDAANAPAAEVRFRALSDRVAADIAEMIDRSAGESRRLALHIEAVSARRRQLSLGLALLCGAATITAALFLARALRTHDRLLRVHRAILERRSSEHEAFAGRVAHDVRGSLAAVSLMFEQIGRLSADGRVTALTDRGARNVEGVVRLMEGLLQFARAGARAEPGARADLDGVVSEVTAALRAEAASARAELIIDPASHAVVSCSAGVLSSLLGNLVGNALKHMGGRAERRVTVRSRRRGAVVRVEVEDTGPGIEPELREAIFEPFVRGKDNGTPGIGLGLATVKRLAEGHGGRVGVDSGGAGGSLFWFELPRAEDRELGRPAPAPAH